MANILKMIVVLAALCGFSGFLLSYLKTVTADAIETQVLANVQGPAINSIFAGAENNPLAERRVFTLADGSKVTVFPCVRAGKLDGVAIEASGKGYGGPVGVLVGFNTANDTLAGIDMTQLKETPGIGMRVREPGFRAQFAGKAMPVQLSSKGGTIDAVSGATISSNGVIEAVGRAGEIYKELKPELAQWKK